MPSCYRPVPGLVVQQTASHPLPSPAAQVCLCSPGNVPHFGPVCQQQRWEAGEFVVIFNKDYNKSEEGDKANHQDHRLGIPIVLVLGEMLRPGYPQPEKCPCPGLHALSAGTAPEPMGDMLPILVLPAAPSAQTEPRIQAVCILGLKRAAKAA